MARLLRGRAGNKAKKAHSGAAEGRGKGGRECAEQTTRRRAQVDTF